MAGVVAAGALVAVVFSQTAGGGFDELEEARAALSEVGVVCPDADFSAGLTGDMAGKAIQAGATTAGIGTCEGRWVLGVFGSEEQANAVATSLEELDQSLVFTLEVFNPNPNGGQSMICLTQPGTCDTPETVVFENAVLRTLDSTRADALAAALASYGAVVVTLPYEGPTPAGPAVSTRAPLATTASPTISKSPSASPKPTPTKSASATKTTRPSAALPTTGTLQVTLRGIPTTGEVVGKPAFAVWNSRDKLLYTRTISSNGQSFSFSKLPAGTYELGPVATGCWYPNPSVVGEDGVPLEGWQVEVPFVKVKVSGGSTTRVSLRIDTANANSC